MFFLNTSTTKKRGKKSISLQIPLPTAPIPVMVSQLLLWWSEMLDLFRKKSRLTLTRVIAATSRTQRCWSLSLSLWQAHHHHNYLYNKMSLTTCVSHLETALTINEENGWRSVRIQISYLPCYVTHLCLSWCYVSNVMKIISKSERLMNLTNDVTGCPLSLPAFF